MISLDKVHFDFRMADESFARTLYGQWDGFCRKSFVQVVENVLSRFEQSRESYYLEKLIIDLGTLREIDFYEKFPHLLEEKLLSAFEECLREPQNHGLKIVTAEQEMLEWLAYYLLHGYLRWDTPEEFRGILRFLPEVMSRERDGLRRFLYREGYRESLRFRLAGQLDDAALESLVMLTEQREAEFVCLYTRSMITFYPLLPHPGIVRREYRNALWFLVLTYLWSESKGFFSRKQLVKQTVTGLAARYGVDFTSFLDLLMQGVKQVMVSRVADQGLWLVLFELRAEQRETATVPDERQQVWVRCLKGKTVFWGQEAFREFGKGKDELLREIRLVLSHPESCRKLLNVLAEAEICKLVCLVVPEEAEFVLSYARQLERGKEQGIFEGKAGGEFRLVKWEFLFAVLLKYPASIFTRKYFISGVLQKLAAHYGLDYPDLVEYFFREKELLPEELRLILAELYGEVTGNSSLWLVTAPAGRVPSSGERLRLIWILRHPLSCRRFLSRLGEEQIYRLADMALPGESSFVVAYARELDGKQERGMFEGKSGSDFRIVKWEFIFSVTLDGRFNHKYMVASVLRYLAAHYGMDYAELLDYFHRYLPVDHLELQTVMTELWQENQVCTSGFLPAFTLTEREARCLFLMESFLITGIPFSGKEEPAAVFIFLSCTVPDKLMEVIQRFSNDYRISYTGFQCEGGCFYASVILWYIRRKGIRFPGYAALLPLLESVESGRITADGMLLRQFLSDLAGERKQALGVILSFILSHKPLPEFLVRNPDRLYIRQLLADYDQAEIKAFIDSHRGLFKKLFFSSPDITREVVRAMGCISGLSAFLYGLYGEKNVLEILSRQGVEYLPVPWDGSGLLQYIAEMADFHAVYRLLLKEPDTLRKIWKEATAVHQRRITGLLSGDSQLQWLWICRVGSSALWKMAEEVLRLQRRLPFRLDDKVLLDYMVECSVQAFMNFSEAELFARFRAYLLVLLNEKQLVLLNKTLSDNRSEFSGLSVGVEEEQKRGGARQDVVIPDESPERMPVYVGNAGLVLLSPWLPVLFDRLGLLKDKKEFTGPKAQVKAIFLSQALLYDKGEFSEHTLVLNKVLTGWRPESPLPFVPDCGEKEREILSGMIKGVISNWDKIRNTSVEGFRQSFLLREGRLEEKEDSWFLTVDERGYDVLLDTVPWGYKFVKYPWMNKPLNVVWR